MNTIDWGAPLQLRDGRPARLVCALKSTKYTRLVVVTNTDGEEWALAVGTSGLFIMDASADVGNNRDVINVPKKPVWLNIYLLSDGDYSVCEHTSKESADAAVDENHRRVACIETI